MPDCGDCKERCGAGEETCLTYPQAMPVDNLTAVDGCILIQAADEEVGVAFRLAADAEAYDPTEVLEIQDMILRVLKAWRKGRDFRLAHPEAYGMAVN